MEKKYYRAYRDIAQLFIETGLNKNQSKISAEDALSELKKLGEADPETWDVDAIKNQLKPYLPDENLTLPSENEKEDENEGCAPASGGIFLRLTFFAFILIIVIFAGWKACNL